ncbi:hypothetical protein Bca4012_063425 [Brassica carinata]|uniref:Uncharacterized protein n=1 Tax=Brassica carinata TaxID=52824 RepID=A0A8X7V7A9_BRACI|nr:hypothetical protein Bca52824_033423 [Brassica carinata]
MAGEIRFYDVPRSRYRWSFIGGHRPQLSFIVSQPFLTLTVVFAAGTYPAPSEGESTVLRARQIPLDRREVNFLVSETIL